MSNDMTFEPEIIDHRYVETQVEEVEEAVAAMLKGADQVELICPRLAEIIRAAAEAWQSDPDMLVLEWIACRLQSHLEVLDHGLKERDERIAALQAKLAPAVVCCVCQKVLKEGREPVSHTYCPDCDASERKRLGLKPRGHE